MKKVLSLLLAFVMAFSALAPITAFANSGNIFDQYVHSLGKKGGEIYGSYESVRLTVSKYNLQGYDEVISLVNQSEEKFTAAMEAERAACLAHVEVEKDKIQAMGIKAEASEEYGTGQLEGFGSSIGDPSACARDLDIIVADCYAALSDFELAVEKYNKAVSGNFEGEETYDSLMLTADKIARRAFLEYCDAEETHYKLYLMFEDSWDYVLSKNEPLFDMYERALNLVEKANSDVQKNQYWIEKAKEEITAAENLSLLACEKAAFLCNNASEEEKPYCEIVNNTLRNLAWYDEINEKIKGDLGYSSECIDNIVPAVFDVSLDSEISLLERMTFISLYELRKTFPSILLSKWFLTANELTYNGKEQPLVTLGEHVYNPDGEKVLFALGNAPDGKLDEVVYDDFNNDSYVPEESKFTEKLPTAKEPGTYYVYAKFPDSVRIVTKVVIKSHVIKNNTLVANGKTVKVKRSKLKKKAQTIKCKNAITVKGAQGTVTYKIAKKSKNFKVAKNGNITVKKGLKKGTYKVKIKVTAAGNEFYKSATKTVTVKIKVN